MSATAGTEVVVVVHTGGEEGGDGHANGIQGGSQPELILAPTSALWLVAGAAAHASHATSVRRRRRGAFRCCFLCTSICISIGGHWAWKNPPSSAALLDLEVLEATEEEADGVNGGRSARFEPSASTNAEEDTGAPPALSLIDALSSDSSSARSARNRHLRRSRQMYRTAMTVR